MENDTRICEELPDRERWKLHLPETDVQHQRQKPRK